MYGSTNKEGDNMANEDEWWRSVVNNLRSEDLPEDGTDSPEMESVPKLPQGTTSAQQKLFVQKMITEVYVYTDLAGNAFGQQSFQTSFPLGEMTAKKLTNMLERERRKKNK